jgi:predicted MPP superfamily phosphohydrolase
MRSYSLFTIVLLCLAILIVDIISFYWLQSITSLISSSALVTAIHIAFWVFTVGLICAILTLKTRLDYVNPLSKQRWISSLYGLTVSSFIPKLIFSSIISILYVTNYAFSEKASLIIVPLIGLFSGIIPFVVIAYGVFKTAYKFKVQHLHLKLDTLPKAFNHFKIVQISDIHIGSFNYRYKILEKAITTINDLEPDLIVFTGDLVNNYAWELEGWDTVFNKLQAKTGKYAILGNHDYGDYSDWDTKEEKQQNAQTIQSFLKNTGFYLLLNDAQIIRKGYDNLAIIGVENWGLPPFKQYGDLDTALQNVSNIPFKILLSHDPAHWSEEVCSKTNIALTLSGHTHGMQAGIKIGKKKWSPIQYQLEHWAGLYKDQKQYLYVNRGLGWIGFPGRIGMRPEITCIELVKE